MRILVTGGAGFIGSHIVDRFIDAGHEVTVLDDLSTGHRKNLNPKANFVESDICATNLDQVFEQGKFEVVCHQAANVSVSYSVRNPMEDARINVMGVINILENCRKYGVKKVIFASSGGVCYGDAPVWPATEELPYAPISPYGITKVATEWYLRFYHRQYGMNFTSLRYSNVYGPRQDPHGEAGVVAIFSKLLIAGAQPTINGDGLHVRDYVFVRDVVEANFLALSHGDNDSFNVGTGRETTNTQLFETLKAVTSFPGEAHYGPERPGDLRKNVLSAQKIHRVMGWSPRFSLEDGLRETVEWFRRNG